MSELPIKEASTVHKITRHNAPPLGQYRWLKTEEGEVLACLVHIASNHVLFSKSDEQGGENHWRVRYRDLEAETRVEPNWRVEIQKQIDDKQADLSAAVASMVEMCRNADLIQDHNAPPSLLPSTTRHDPTETKKSLLALKEEKFPAAQKTVENITQAIVALHKDLYLPLHAEAEKMRETVKGVDKRLFALELYAGIGERAKLIKSGKPAEPETPISVRQMMRYMDEETLIDYDKGGMDYKNISDFDEWVIRPENLNRLAPEQRCVVALKVRRNPKDYGRPLSIANAFEQVEEHYANMKTYLLIRNGEMVYRLATEISFDPRLIPFSNEFHKPLTEYRWHSDDGEEITPDHLGYDKAMNKRLDEIYEYNRVMFLIQGLIDRSKVFNPHPPINLADESHVEKYFYPIFDEEKGLPSSNPPSWEKYRDAANRTLKPGSFVWCDVVEDPITIWNRFGKWKKPHPSSRRPRICRVKSVSKDRKKVILRWSLGDKIKEHWVIDKTRPVPNEPGYFFQKKIEDNLGERFSNQTVEIEECFAIEAYKPGDYKKFLCDAHLKGAYLRWSPQLLSAEKWFMQQAKIKQQPS